MLLIYMIVLSNDYFTANVTWNSVLPPFGERKSLLLSKQNSVLSSCVISLSLVKWNLNDENMHYKLNIMENVATAFVFVIVVVNVFITAFGVQLPTSSA